MATDHLTGSLSSKIGLSGGLSGALANAVLRGLSAYEIAVEEGFEGDKKAWLESLRGGKIELRSVGNTIEWKYADEDEDKWQELLTFTATMDYEDLSNRPSINGTELSSGLTSEDLGLQSAGDYLQTEDINFISNQDIEAMWASVLG